MRNFISAKVLLSTGKEKDAPVTNSSRVALRTQDLELWRAIPSQCLCAPLAWELDTDSWCP